MTTNTKAKPDELPDSVTKTIYLRYKVGGYFAGELSILDFEFEDSDTITICSKEVTIKIPKNLDIKGLALKSLEEEKAKVLAENHQRLKSVQDKIDNLLAIDYKPGEAA